jgi:nitrite reductase (NADH) small subunit
MSNWIKIGTLTDIPKLGARIVKSEQGDIAVFRTSSDEIFALKDECPHKKGQLSQGIVHGKKVTCPLHNWKIKLDTGEAVAPDDGCTPKYQIKLDGETVLIKL